jgi:tetratricopeptide (TPR) repeat protein
MHSTLAIYPEHGHGQNKIRSGLFCIRENDTLSKRHHVQSAAADTLQTGLTHHRAGRLAEASACYTEILRKNPFNADALNLSGIIARQRGDLATAERLIRKAIGQNPRAATYHHNLGRTFEAQGLTADAMTSYRKALSLAPQDAESMEHLFALLPEHGETAEAIDLCQRLITVTVGRSDLHFKLTGLRRRAGDRDGALEQAREAARLFPQLADSHFNLADTLYAKALPSDSLAAYRKGLAIDPNNAEAHNSCGRILHDMGELQAALESYNRAQILKPGSARVLSNLAVLCMDLGDLRKSEELLRRAIALKPDFLDAHATLGALLERQGKSLDAIECFRKVLLAEPEHIAGLCNLGLTLDHLGDEDAAAACYQLAITKQPESPLARFNLSMHHLANGRFPEGWREYEERWHTSQFVSQQRALVQPQWRGEEIRGKRILIHAEQGLGDTIQFTRYLPLLASLQATVILEVQPAVQRLLANVEGASQVIAKGDPLPALDLHCPLMSLPAIFGTALTNIPAPHHLASTQASAATSTHHGLRVGIVWSGNPAHVRDHQRSIQLAQLTPLFDLPGTTFYSLQKGPATQQLQALQCAASLIDLSAELQDFTDTALILAGLDVIVTVDTAVAHLAATLGKPTWILLPRTADWRWLKERTDSPWYSSARLFRQSKAGDWTGPVQQIRQSLENLAETGSPHHELVAVAS